MSSKVSKQVGPSSKAKQGSESTNKPSNTSASKPNQMSLASKPNQTNPSNTKQNKSASKEKENKKVKLDDSKARAVSVENKNNTCEKTDSKKPKDPYEKLTPKDIQTKIDEINTKIKKEKATRSDTIELYQKDIRQKESSILESGSLNKKLMKELEGIKRDIDSQINRIGIKEIQTQLKAKTKREYPLEIVLKLREKELKNISTIVEILKKENQSLQKNTEEKNSFVKLNELVDRLGLETRKNESLQKELKINQRIADEHKRCSELQGGFSNERVYYQTEIREMRKLLQSLQQLNEEKKESTLKAEERRASLEKALEHKKQILPDINLSRTAQEKQRSQSKESQISQKKEMSKSLDQANREKFQLRRDFKAIDERIEIFSEKEIEILKRYMADEEIELFCDRFLQAASENSNSKRRLAEESKKLLRKSAELEEQLEYSGLQLKVVEQNNKILSFQINEYKNEHRILVKKLHEVVSNSEALRKVEDEKLYENSLLVSQIEGIKVTHLENLEKARKAVTDKGEENSEGKDYEEGEEEEEND